MSLQREGQDEAVVVMYRCPECGAEWCPILERPPHYADCSKIRTAVAFVVPEDPRAAS